MNLTKLTADLNNVQSLEDAPTLTTSELKATFDASGNTIKEYINTIMLDEIEEQVGNEISAMQTTLNNAIRELTETITTALNNAKPVGSLYLTVGNENPSTIWTGTRWEKIENRFLLGSGSRSVNSIGGEENVQLNISQIPAHNHAYQMTSGTMAYDFDRTYNGSGVSTMLSGEAGTTAVGGNQSHNNMPPYIVVHIWKRIA